MEDGMNAAVIASIVTPYIQDRITSTVSFLTQAYRGQQLTHDIMLGSIAQISALQDIISNLESTQRQSELAAKRELGRNG
jgi:hypothetical protein